MTLVDRGSGSPVIVIPGIQGRWEWHRPGIDAMAAHCRVLTFSLADEPGSGFAFDSRSCIDSYCDQIAGAMAQAGLSRAALCGISYGGLVAAVFAARYPDRVSSLVLVSALPPTWAPDRRIQAYLCAPRLLTPVFVASSLRLVEEILTASPRLIDALTTSIQHGWNVVTHMFSPTRMARRVSNLASHNLTAEISRIVAPTLVIVGEPGLDRVVPVSATLEYLRLLSHARVVTLDRTGHLGSITRPAAFADLVVQFLQSTP